VLVNATPVGTAPALDETPLPNGLFTGDVVYDLVYNPSDTRLLRDARAAGCRTVSGLEMLVAQARRQFEWWTGRPAPVAVMREAAVRALAARTNGAARAGHEVTT
jgi:shikimate 5-dehydrogenase